MARSWPIAAILLLAASPLSAQEAGGFPPFGGPIANRSPVPLSTVNPARGRQAVHQERISALRGDPGYLAGFVRGEPVAPSRQPPPPSFAPFPPIIVPPVIVNNLNGQVTVAAPPDTFDDLQINTLGGMVGVAIGEGNTVVQQIETE
ncbi:MAG TPA: hypothetical protein VEB64_16525 [Azospirillaceae bacterium]|nr:hypothetical protein [Azospirillaceae bacterium]